MQLLYKTNQLKQMKAEMKQIKNIQAIKIITAFISESDDNKSWIKEIVLQNSISKEQFEIYLSLEFAPYHKKEILENLMQYATVYVVPKLHAKAYYIEGDSDFFAFGSANFTDNGFGNNLELMGIIEPLEKSVITDFIHYCQENAHLVDSELLNTYDQIDQLTYKVKESKEQRELENAIHHLKNQLQDTKQNEWLYGDLLDFYFNKEDYETFKMPNSKSTEKSIQQRRAKVKEKLVKIHEKIIPDIQKLGLECHYHPGHITNTIELTNYNQYQVGWLGIRYWNDISKLKFSKDSGVFASKYANLQFCLTEDCFQIELFHAVPEEAIDREYLHRHIDQLHDEIENELQVLLTKVDNMKWIIQNQETDQEFVFTTHNISAFINFYKENDRNGSFSELNIQFLPNDERLKEDHIISLILKTIEALVPLYRVLIDPTSYKDFI